MYSLAMSNNYYCFSENFCESLSCTFLFLEIIFCLWIFYLKKTTTATTRWLFPVTEQTDFISEDPVTLLQWGEMAFILRQGEGGDSSEDTWCQAGHPCRSSALASQNCQVWSLRDYFIPRVDQDFARSLNYLGDPLEEKQYKIMITN